MNLLLAPHNDDCELFACYTAIRYRPHVIICLRSERMAASSYPLPHIDHETREAETAEAMSLLGLEWTQWTFGDGDPDWDAVDAAMRRLEYIDGRVFAPAVEDGGHPHHNRIGDLARRVFGDRLTAYTTYTNGTVRSKGAPVAFEPGWPDLKRQAIDCYRSQIDHPMTGHHFAAPLDEFHAL